MKTRLFLAAAVLFMLSACQKESEQSKLEYRIKTTNRSSSVARTMSGNVDWTSGSVYATKIEFEAEKEDSFEVHYEVRVNSRINLFDPLSVLGAITLPPGTYDEIEVEIDLASTATDTAFWLRGTFTDNASQSTPVLFIISDAKEFEAEAEDITISSGSNFTALFTLDLAMLTRGVSEFMLSNATRTNGVIVISKNSNVNIYNIMLQNLEEMDSVEIDD